MFSNKFQRIARKYVTVCALGAASVASSFFLGIHSAGDVQPFTLIEAGTVLPGDMNEDGLVTVADAVIILEITQGYSTATADQVRADPNDDGVLTVNDALQILARVQNR